MRETIHPPPLPSPPYGLPAQRCAPGSARAERKWIEAVEAEQQAVAAAVAHLTTTSKLLHSRLATPPSDLATLKQHCPTTHPEDQLNATCIDEGMSSYINAKGNATREMGTCSACGCTAKTNREQQCANTRTDDNAQSGQKTRRKILSCSD